MNVNCAAESFRAVVAVCVYTAAAAIALHCVNGVWCIAYDVYAEKN